VMNSDQQYGVEALDRDLVSRVASREDMYDLFSQEYTKRERKPLLKSLIVLTQQDPYRLSETVERNKLLSKRYVVTVQEKEHDFYRLHVERKNPVGPAVSVEALIDVKPNLWVIFTTVSLYDAKILVSLFARLYPDFNFAYLNHAQMLHLVEEIKKWCGSGRVVTSFAIKAETETDRALSINRKTLKGLSAEDELVAEAKRGRIWVEKLRFQVKNKLNMLVLDTVLTNRGIARLVYGNFVDFYDRFMTFVIQISAELDGKFSAVRRTIVEGEAQTKPCSIIYTSSFKVTHLKSLASKLNSDYMLSIFHMGNPFFSADLTDCYDGSSFTLTIFQNIITISPMIRTTNTALWKLVGKLQSILGEGDIVI